MRKFTCLIVLTAVLVVAPVAQAATADASPTTWWGWFVDSVVELFLPGTADPGGDVVGVAGGSDHGPGADPFGVTGGSPDDGSTTTTTTTGTGDPGTGGEIGPGGDPFG